ncbi:MAG TPA: ABC transporter permease [Ktedonobacterales bacterium]|nr:ABC transporter permease [Ktedonobacterales bacterium]
MVKGAEPEADVTLDAAGSASATMRAASRPRAALAAMRTDPRWLFGVVLGVLALAAIFAPWVAPYPPLQYHPAIQAQPPTAAHLLGTDDLGRDQLSRVIYGARISLTVGVTAILAGGVAGVLLGIVGGYARGWVDQVITIVVDALLAFPPLLLPLAIAAMLGPSVVNLIAALAIARIPVYARLARGQALQIRSLDYVTAARGVGTRARAILLRHLLPNIFSPLLVQATISVSLAILDESVLSFLGLGAQPPTPDWGSMISAAQTYLNTDPWMMLGPALAIIVTVLSLNLLGDALRDRLDPYTAGQLAFTKR